MKDSENKIDIATGNQWLFRLPFICRNYRGVFVDFIPARNKLEAVARLSNLTNSGPEVLGPGSKERKTVLVNLAIGLSVPINEDESKQQIAKKISTFLGTEWTPECESIGQTITLKGLNLLLEHSSKRLTAYQNKNSHNSLKDETKSIADLVYQHTPRVMDGVTAIKEMREAEFSKWSLTEWQGLYFEFKVRPQLINNLGGAPKKIGRTEFDYALTFPWDMKVHSSVSQDGKKSSTGCQLNDGYSMELAIDQTGLGLIILSGIPSYDLAFTKWFKEYRESKSLTEPKRLLKKEFTAEKVDFFFIPDRERFSEALAKKQMTVFKQGPQQSGHSRNYKYSLNLKKAETTDLLVHSIVLD